MRLGPRLVFSGFFLFVGAQCSGQSDVDERGPHGTSASAGVPAGVAAGTGGSPGIGGGVAGHTGSLSAGGVPSAGGSGGHAESSFHAGTDSRGDGSGGDAGAGNAAGHDESTGGTGLGGDASGGDAGDAGARPTSATGCRHVSCTPLVLSVSGSWEPSTDTSPRQMGDICATPGVAYIDCFPSDGCPGESEPSLIMCCDFGSDGDGGSYWTNACANLCPNDAGQGGESGTSCTEPPSACCTKDADCPSGFECAKGGAGQLGAAHPGAGNACLPRPADRSSCWQDSDCPVGYVCAESRFCGCGYGPCADWGPGSCKPEGH
jgi:hypothetical protein